MEAVCRERLEELGGETLASWTDMTQQEPPSLPEGSSVFPHKKTHFSEQEQLQELQAAKPLLRHLVGRFTKNGLLEYEEGMQEAKLGFLQAMQRYDSQKGCSLRSYAQFWIVNELQQACNRNLLLHVPLGVTKEILADHRAELQETPSQGANPSQVARPSPRRKFQHSVVSKKAATHILLETFCAMRPDNVEVSDEAFVHQRQEAELSKTMPDGSEQICCQVDFKQVIAYLGKLSMLQQRILYLRFFREMTLEEIGQCLGISREGVRQTQERGLARIRKYLGVTC